MGGLGFVVDLSGGTGHTCALDSERTLSCVGDNSALQICDDTVAGCTPAPTTTASWFPIIL